MLHWKDYLYFEANEVEEDSKKDGDIIIKRLAKTYKVIKSLAMPNKTAEKSFKEIVDLLKEHQVPKPKKLSNHLKSIWETEKRVDCRITLLNNTLRLQRSVRQHVKRSVSKWKQT